MEERFLEFVKKLHQPENDSNKTENGQLTIIGGASLFHGPPIMALKVASRIVDMVYLATPSEQKEIADRVKSEVSSFIWVPRVDLEKYIEKSDAVLIGPGMMRYEREGDENGEMRDEKCENGFGNGKLEIEGKRDDEKIYDSAGTETKRMTEYLLQKFSEKKWIIDGGALQTMDAKYIPKGAVLTPNKKEFLRLFGEDMNEETVSKYALKYSCVIVGKLPTSVICDGKMCQEIGGSILGLTKGGTGDTLAATIASFACKNEAFLAAIAGIVVGRVAAERLVERVGTMFNSEDLADEIPKAYWECLKNS